MKKALVVLLILVFIGSAMALPMATSTKTLVKATAKPVPVKSVPVCEKGDFNDDHKVTFADIDPFVAALFGPIRMTPKIFCEADINQDGFLNQADIDPFVAIIGTVYPQ